jgi:hypothetical protein
MPRTSLTVQNCGRLTALTNPTANTPDAVNGNRFTNTDSNVILYVRNTNASSRTLTIQTVGTVEGEAVPDKTYVLATNTRTVIGPFPRTKYNQTLDSVENQVALNWDAVTDVTIELIKVQSASVEV